jgi:hypothetical protein
MSICRKTPERRAEAERQVSRWVALMPVWVLLRVLALGLSRPHPLRQLSFRAFVVHARERAFWVGVGLYAGVAVWLRLLLGFFSVPAKLPLFPLSLLFP